jgi:hypothetical protein
VRIITGGVAFLCLTLNSLAGAVVIGHTNTQSVARMPQSVMDQVGRLRWFLAHASVGANMMEGLNLDLHQPQQGFYQLVSAAGLDSPPASTQPGVVYEYYRGNPGWQPKVDWFASYVTNGWFFPKVDVVMNKFCFIDLWATSLDVNYYITNMAALENAYSQTWFVYATIPLVTAEDFRNHSASLFNETLRSWVRANNRILFDIADIEAHDTNGVEQTFIYQGRVCQKLYSGYTTDGGHPDVPVGRRQLALGFYALSAALLGVDGNNSLKLQNLQFSVQDGLFRMEFIASSNISYTVQCRSNLVAGSWVSLTNISALPYNRIVQFSDSSNSNNAIGFYRVTGTNVP